MYVKLTLMYFKSHATLRIDRKNNTVMRLVNGVDAVQIREAVFDVVSKVVSEHFKADKATEPFNTLVVNS